MTLFEREVWPRRGRARDIRHRTRALSVTAVENDFVEGVYDKLASIYDLIFGPTLHPGSPAGDSAHGSARRGPHPRGRSRHRHQRALYPRDCEVTGIDFSASMLEKARERVAKKGMTGVRLLQMDAADLKFDDNSFDIVYAPYLISVVPDPVKVAARDGPRLQARRPYHLPESLPQREPGRPGRAPDLAVHHPHRLQGRPRPQGVPGPGRARAGVDRKGEHPEDLVAGHLREGLVNVRPLGAGAFAALAACGLCLWLGAPAIRAQRAVQPASTALPSAADGRGSTYRAGGIIRGPVSSRRLALVFTAHEFAEGGPTILDQLAARRLRASFFLTGEFLRNAAFAPLVHRMVAGRHYVGPHSDKHLLYCEWAPPSHPTRITRAEFVRDVEDNLAELTRFAVDRRELSVWVPAYEHYNDEIAAWSRDLGLQVASFSYGTRANADYTGEADANFVASDRILESIREKAREPAGLNGFILLMHLGAGPGRRDKLHDRLGALLDWLLAEGYQPVGLDELLK